MMPVRLRLPGDLAVRTTLAVLQRLFPCTASKDSYLLLYRNSRLNGSGMEVVAHEQLSI